MPKIFISLPTGDVSKELTGDVVSIGRTPDNKIQIDHHTVSAHHAKLVLVNGNYRIKDLDSTNRTCVNGMPVNEAELAVSCILRIGSIECVYKTDKPDASGDMIFQVAELQRQVESLMKARDLIHQQNRTLVKERDDARHDADERLDQLNDAKRTIEQLSAKGGGVVINKQQVEETSAKATESKKQIELMSREREALLISNQELKAQLASLTARVSDLQQKVTQAEIQRHVAASVQQHANASAAAQQHVSQTVQEQAAARVKADMDESVEEDDAELVGAGQKASAAGGAVGRIISGAPLLGSWLNRGGKRKSEAGNGDTGKITPMEPEQQIEAESQDSAETAAPTDPPPLRLVRPPAVPDSQNIHAGSPAVKIGRVSANAAPQHPEIRPVWELLNTLRRSLHYFLRHQDELKVLQEMSENAHLLTAMTQQAELLRPIHELALAQESLVADLHSSPANISPSTLRTVGQCIDFIATLIHESNLSQIKDVTTARIFAIDDDEGILETIKATMEMVNVNIDSSSQSSMGLNLLSEQNYDLILLDVGMPEMNGMDICSRVRAMPHHQKTPIVFLTGEATVQNRVQSTLNGGNDMIGKPFSVLELAVKVIVWIFKGQLAMV